MNAAKPAIGVLFGGCSNEYSVSLHSAAAVLNAIDRKRFSIVAIGIDRRGRWYRYTGDYAAIEQDTWLESGCCSPVALSFGASAHSAMSAESPDLGAKANGEPDCGVLDLESGTVMPLDAVLPILHGRNGEDGSVQGALQLAGIPVVGCGITGSAVCMDKVLSHRIAVAEGVSVAEHRLVDAATDPKVVQRLAETVGYPLFVKPPHEGSSLGLSRVERPVDLMAAVDRALAFDAQVMLERAIDGAEIGCAVLETAEGLVVGVPDEIELNGAVFDFTEKYSCETANIIVPARISEYDKRRVTEAAKRLFRAFGCTGFARIDFFLARNGHLYFNEANTIPGFTAHSRFPSMLEAAGIPLEKLLTIAIEKALVGATIPGFEPANVESSSAEPADAGSPAAESISAKSRSTASPRKASGDDVHALAYA